MVDTERKNNGLPTQRTLK